jgi:CSLREA domain-containing protein
VAIRKAMRVDNWARMSALWFLVVLAAVSIVVLVAIPARASTTFTVTNTADPGNGTCNTSGCTLREAIDASNATPGKDAIHFHIQGDTQTIEPKSELPNIEDAVTIDGYTQPGAKPNTVTQGTNAVLKIEISGEDAGSTTHGFLVRASNSVVKGLAINRFRGIGLEIGGPGADARNNRVVGNFIGTDLTGNAAPTYASNSLEGINLEDRITNNVITNNVIANNGREGIRGGPLVAGTVVQDNWIGISPSGSPMPNKAAGVQPQGTSSGWRIGPGNTIAFNGNVGVRVINVDSDRNTITRNSIFSNTGLGIDLDPLNTPNQNDADDADRGANEQLNFPVIRTATPQQVSGTACGGCTVEVFKADSGANSYGEGKTFLGSTTAGGDGAFSLVVSGVAAGNYVTATATDAAGNTSEFSLNFRVA